MTATDVTARLRERATELGLALFGVTEAGASDHGDPYQAWIDAGLHGEMGYLARPDAIARRRDSRASLAGARSAIVVGHVYGSHSDAPDPLDPRAAVVARYARGLDYHDVLLEKLNALGATLTEVLGAEAAWRAWVDTGPILERDLARRAGLGWFGRNTMLINPNEGSWFLLGVILTDGVLEPTPSFEEDRCGSCRACLDACPTGALLGRDESGAPVIDARRCISYLTIELKGAVPAELRPLLGNRVFGCDICQEVCPWNERFGAESEGAPEYGPRRDLDTATLVTLADRFLAMSEKAYQREFADSPLARPRRRGMLRNLCIAIGNWLAVTSVEDSAKGIAFLERAIDDGQPIVRAHAAWALGQASGSAARHVLEQRHAVESDEFVRAEIASALGEPAGDSTSA